MIEPTRQQLQARVAQLEAELEHARAMLGPISETELKRRVEVLVKRSEREPYGRIVCLLCPKLKLTPGKMRVHLLATHRGEILIAPQATFD